MLNVNFGHFSKLALNPPHLLPFLPIAHSCTHKSKQHQNPVKYVGEVIKCHAKYAHKGPNYVYLHSLSVRVVLLVGLRVLLLVRVMEVKLVGVSVVLLVGLKVMLLVRVMEVKLLVVIVGVPTGLMVALFNRS